MFPKKAHGLIFSPMISYHLKFHSTGYPDFTFICVWRRKYTTQPWDNIPEIVVFWPDGITHLCIHRKNLKTLNVYTIYEIYHKYNIKWNICLKIWKWITLDCQINGGCQISGGSKYFWKLISRGASNSEGVKISPKTACFYNN